MLNLKKMFSGNFEKDCQKESAPYLLQSLVSMTLRGSNIKGNVEDIPDTHIPFLNCYNSTVPLEEIDQ